MKYTFPPVATSQTNFNSNTNLNYTGYNTARVNTVGSATTTTSISGGQTYNYDCSYTFNLDVAQKKVKSLTYQGNNCSLSANKASFTFINNLKQAKAPQFGVLFGNSGFQGMLSEKAKPSISQLDLSKFKLVSYVVPDSPADLAKIKVGMYMFREHENSSLETEESILFLKKASSVSKTYNAVQVKMKPKIMSKAYFFMSRQQRSLFGVFE